MFDGGDGIADQPEREKYFDHGEATKAALVETIKAKSDRVCRQSCKVQPPCKVQPRLVAVPDRMLFRMAQIAIRPKIPNMIAVMAAGIGEVQNWSSRGSTGRLKVC